MMLVPLSFMVLSAGATARSTPVPSTMAAFVQRSAIAQKFESDAPTPYLGSLRALYTGLPASCEVLVRVEFSSVNPSDRFPTVASSTLPHVRFCPRREVVLKCRRTGKSLLLRDTDANGGVFRCSGPTCLAQWLLSNQIARD